MNTTERDELFELLRELSDRFPEMRMGQLVSNLAMAARGANGSATWDADDQELIAAAQRWLSRPVPSSSDPVSADR